MKRNLLAFCFLLTGFMVSAQFTEGSLIISTDIAMDEPVSLSSQTTSSSDLDPDLELILAVVTDSLRNHFGMKSLSAAVIMPDNSFFKGAAGQSSAIIPATPDHRYGMGSITKTFTAAAMIKLNEMGLLSLSDSIGVWFSQLPNIAGHITVTQLLNHTSGIANVTENPAFYLALNAQLDSVWDPYNVVEQFTLEPVLSPGDGWYYSNTNYLLAGLIIESVTGKPFHMAVRELVIDPLDLPAVNLAAHEALGIPVAHVWGDPGTGILIDFTSFGISLTSLYSMAWASGAMFATPYELSVWMRTLFEGGTLSEESVEQMNNFIQLNPLMGYGLGIMKQNIHGYTGYGHNGYIYYGASSLYFPNIGLTISLMTNDGSFSGMFWPDLTHAYIKAYEQWLEGHTPVTEAINHTALQVYPNPASEYICVHTDEMTWIRLYNMAGQVVYHHKAGQFEYEYCITVENLPGSMYRLVVHGANGISGTQVMIR